MSSCLRYRNQTIRQHLASHYVLGVLSRRVARRCEAIMRKDAEFEAAVYEWQKRMNQMDSNLTPMTVPEEVWAGIEAKLDDATAPSLSHFNPLSWLSNLTLLRTALAVALCFTFFTTFAPEKDHAVTASYVALMSSDADQAEPGLVVSAYQGANPGESNLRFQWNERSESIPLNQLGVIAIDRETGEALFLGTITDEKAPMFLDKPAWLAVKNSAELLIVKGDTVQAPVVFRGPCVQLEQWI